MCLLSLTRSVQLGVEPCGYPAHPNLAKPGAGRYESCSGSGQAWLLQDSPEYNVLVSLMSLVVNTENVIVDVKCDEK